VRDELAEMPAAQRLLGRSAGGVMTTRIFAVRNETGAHTLDDIHLACSRASYLRIEIAQIEQLAIGGRGGKLDRQRQEPEN
jgi:hypothetical protein